MDRLLSFLSSRDGKTTLAVVACVGAAVGAYAAYRAVTAPAQEAATQREDAAAKRSIPVPATPVGVTGATMTAAAATPARTPAAAPRDELASPPHEPTPAAAAAEATSVAHDDDNPAEEVVDVVEVIEDEGGGDLESLVPALLQPSAALIRPAYDAALEVARDLTPHQVATLMLLCVAAIVAYLLTLMMRPTPGGEAPFVPVAWATLGYLAASGAMASARTKSRPGVKFIDNDDGVASPAAHSRVKPFAASPATGARRAVVAPQRGAASPAPPSGGRATPLILSPPRLPRTPAPHVDATPVAATPAATVDPTPTEAAVAPAAAADAAPAAAAATSTAAPDASNDVSDALTSRLNAMVRCIDACDRSDEYEKADALLTAAVALLRSRDAAEEPQGADIPEGSPSLESICTAAWLERYERDYPPLPPSRPRLSAALLWRRARNCSKTGTWLLTHRLGPNPSASDLERVRQIYVLGLQAAKDSLRAYEPDADAHKFAGILSARAAADTKAKIANAYTIREHTLRAIQLRPHDPVLQHIMGVWAFEVASLSWVSRQVASALFGRPPTATYDDALGHLLKSEELGSAPGGGGPMFGTRLKLAQTYMNMGNRAKAVEWIKACAEVRVAAGEDPDDVRVASALASKLGVPMPVPE